MKPPSFRKASLRSYRLQAEHRHHHERKAPPPARIATTGCENKKKMHGTLITFSEARKDEPPKANQRVENYAGYVHRISRAALVVVRPSRRVTLAFGFFTGFSLRPVVSALESAS